MAINSIDPFAIGGTTNGLAPAPGGVDTADFRLNGAYVGVDPSLMGKASTPTTSLAGYSTGMYGNAPVPQDALSQFASAITQNGGNGSAWLASQGGAQARQPLVSAPPPDSSHRLGPSDTGGRGTPTTYAQPTQATGAETGGYDPMMGKGGIQSLIGSAAQDLYGSVLRRKGEDFETQYWQDYSKTHSLADTQSAFINAAQAELNGRRTSNPGTEAPYATGQYQTGGVTNWNVAPNQTVAGQITNLVDPNSPLIQQAQAMAQQAFQARGLGNSSMATTAGQDAAYRTALPIAQQDASTHATAAQTNAGAANQLNLTGMQLNNAKDIANLQAQTQAMNNASAQYIAQQQNATTLANTGLQTASNEKITGMNNATTLTQTGMNNATQLGITNLNNLSAEAIAKLNSTTQLSVTDKNNLTQLSITDKNNASAQQIARINQETAEKTNALDNATKAQVQSSINDYSKLINTSSNAATLVNNYVNQVFSIQNDNGKSPEVKAQAIANLGQKTRDSLHALDIVSGLSFSIGFQQGLAGTPGFKDDGSWDPYYNFTTNKSEPPGSAPPPSPTPSPSPSTSTYYPS